jgi:hypothetical protein
MAGNYSYFRRGRSELSAWYEAENKGIRYNHYKPISLAAKVNSEMRSLMIGVPQDKLLHETKRLFKRLADNKRIPCKYLGNELCTDIDTYNMLQDAFIGYDVNTYLGVDYPTVKKFVSDGLLHFKWYGERMRIFSAKEIRNFKNNGPLYKLHDAAKENAKRLAEFLGSNISDEYKTSLQRFQTWARKDYIKSYHSGKRGIRYIDKKTYDFLADVIVSGQDVIEFLETNPSTFCRKARKGRLESRKIGKIHVLQIEWVKALKKNAKS